ncbi:ABC transporter ATP-binding protein [Streptomyces sp. NPDC059002]|uniref:ABC transporter ATP-binding protein n=1 Tax=Streptomyces sp. NPDC059002 TaxID=3346690 RepID=UPI0036B78C27
MLLPLLRQRLRPYRRSLALVVLLQIAQALAALELPNLNADLIDHGVLTGDTGYILRTGGVMAGIALVQICCSITAVYLSSRVGTALGHDLRAAVFDRVLSFSVREVGRFGTASLFNRTTNDVQQVQLLTLLTGTLLVPAPIVCVGGVVMALRLDGPLSGLFAVIIPVLVLVVGFLLGRMLPLNRLAQTRLDRTNGILREQITGVRVIRAFVRDDRERRRFTEANEELTDVSLRVSRLMAVMFPILMLVIYLSSVAVLWFGGHRIDAGPMAVGALPAYLSYLMQILMSILSATFMFTMIPRAAVCAERIQDVLGTEPTLRAPDHGSTALPRAGEVDLAAAEFRYPGAESAVLQGVDLIARPGTTTAIVGGTGSGKTTLLNLVPRLMEASAGTVRVGGVDVRELAPEVLQAQVGYVPQRAFLFSGTVADNLRHGKHDATEAEMWRALEVAQAREFVERLPQGLAATVAQGGSNLSGGQRQRLAMARALIRRPAIYLFDDSFSALDHATEAALRAALAAETAGATVLVVAQRVSTIRDADHIVVLDKGRVVGTGTHTELLAHNATYQEIALSQPDDQEAA